MASSHVGGLSGAFIPVSEDAGMIDSVRAGALSLEKLEAMGVPVTYRLYGNDQAPLDHVFHCDIRSEAAKRCNREECEFFREIYASACERPADT